jgi:ADP-ribose pyrophosphatase YjhB (NUDIX family)
LKREIREELDVDIEVEDLVFQTSHDYPDVMVTLFFYRCVLKGAPRPLLGQEMRWVRREELLALSVPPADEALIRQLAAG